MEIWLGHGAHLLGQTVRSCCEGSFCLFIYLFIYFVFFGATPAAYGGAQARGLIGAEATGLHHSHSNARSELRL